MTLAGSGGGRCGRPAPSPTVGWAGHRGSPGEARGAFETTDGSSDPALRRIALDEDGYYVLGYKHKGRAANYQIRWCDAENCTGDQHVTAYFPLQGNGTVEIDLEAVDSCDALNDPGSDWEAIEPFYAKGKFKN